MKGAFNCIWLFGCSENKAALAIELTEGTSYNKSCRHDDGETNPNRHFKHQAALRYGNAKEQLTVFSMQNEHSTCAAEGKKCSFGKGAKTINTKTDAKCTVESKLC